MSCIKYKIINHNITKGFQFYIVDAIMITTANLKSFQIIEPNRKTKILNYKKEVTEIQFGYKKSLDKYSYKKIS